MHLHVHAVRVTYACCVFNVKPRALTRKHCCGNIVSYQCFAMFPRVGKHWETLVRNIGKHQMFLKLVGNIFASREANFVSATMFPPVGKHGNTERKKLDQHRKKFEETSRIRNVSATMFPSLPRALL